MHMKVSRLSCVSSMRLTGDILLSIYRMHVKCASRCVNVRQHLQQVLIVGVIAFRHLPTLLNVDVDERVPPTQASTRLLNTETPVAQAA